AVPNIDKRLARVRDIEREVGSTPSLIRRLYVHPQWFYKISLIAVSFIGVIMVLVFLYGLLRPNAPLPPALARFKEGENCDVVAFGRRRHVRQFCESILDCNSELHTSMADKAPAWH